MPYAFPRTLNGCRPATLGAAGLRSGLTRAAALPILLCPVVASVLHAASLSSPLEESSGEVDARLPDVQELSERKLIGRSLCEFALAARAFALALAFIAVCAQQRAQTTRTIVSDSRS